MKKISILLLIITLFASCKDDKKEEIKTTAQTEQTSNNEPFVLKVEKIDSTQFPKSIKYEGFVKNALKWKDKAGDHIVIITETGYHINKKFVHESDGSDAELFAYHYIISGNEAKQSWKVYDYVSDCPVDIVASFVKNTLQVTDNNNNGIAEIWLMYKTACHGDVSPSEMKIIMYEGSTKYAMRGENKVAVGIGDNGTEQYIGGEFKFDENFKKGPKVFKEFAQKLWDDNVIEKWED